jgi:hypothetical protein
MTGKSKRSRKKVIGTEKVTKQEKVTETGRNNKNRKKYKKLYVLQSFMIERYL